LKNLLESRGQSDNVLIYPGDIITVPRAGIVYVVGEVKKPGGFLMNTNAQLSVLQALALAEGLTPTSAKKDARIIRTSQATGKRMEIRIDLGRVLAGKAPDPLLHSKDILFVPNSASKTAFYRGAEATLSIVGGLIVYRR
jgi:polysaccharide export outer membrane protein